MKELITANKCYVQDTCKKFHSGECDYTNDSFCIRLYKMDNLYDLSLLTSAQRKNINLYLDNDHTDEEEYLQLQRYKNNILDFVESGSNLYIYSSRTGNGKTSWTLKFIQAYVQKVWPSSDLTCRALFINVPKYTRELKLHIDKKSDYILHVNEYVEFADLVVWDDIATKHTTPYEHEQLLALLESRLDDKKCNIFTSNIPPSDLINYLGNRLASRITGNSIQIEFKGKDKRGFVE